METDEVAKLQKEIRSLKKQVERLEASRATFELMVDRNDKLLSRQLEQTQRQAMHSPRGHMPRLIEVRHSRSPVTVHEDYQRRFFSMP